MGLCFVGGVCVILYWAYKDSGPYQGTIRSDLTEALLRNLQDVLRPFSREESKMVSRYAWASQINASASR